MIPLLPFASPTIRPAIQYGWRRFQGVLEAIAQITQHTYAPTPGQGAGGAFSDRPDFAWGTYGGPLSKLLPPPGVANTMRVQYSGSFEMRMIVQHSGSGPAHTVEVFDDSTPDSQGYFTGLPRFATSLWIADETTLSSVNVPLGNSSSLFPNLTPFSFLVNPGASHDTGAITRTFAGDVTITRGTVQSNTLFETLDYFASYNANAYVRPHFEFSWPVRLTPLGTPPFSAGTGFPLYLNWNWNQPAIWPRVRWAVTIDMA